MAESLLYLSADVPEIERILLGEDRSVSAAVAVSRNGVRDPIAAACIDEMMEGQTFTWDAPPLRSATWRTYRELSGFIASIYRLFGRDLGFDAWEDGLRLQFLLADWYPIEREKILSFICRPPRPIRFRDIDPRNVEACHPYLESFPHGFVLRSELPALLDSLHVLLLELHRALCDDGSPCALAQHAPGRPLSGAQLLEFMTLNDDSLQGWQCARATMLYNAGCEALLDNRDLVMVGY